MIFMPQCMSMAIAQTFDVLDQQSPLSTAANIQSAKVCDAVAATVGRWCETARPVRRRAEVAGVDDILQILR